MTSDIVIDVKNLSKVYKVYARPIDLLLDVVGLRRDRFREFKALQNVTFSVRRGEVIGIIGRNGSGKSTLLKILAKTLDHTSGDVRVFGRLSAILELGTGFNPELSGRENVIIGGMCLGMSRSQVESKLDGIIDFSGLRNVIDQPFKTYSSGMQARLTFSTAIAIDPDILIVDEALAAGDAFFVSKSMKRIDEICRSGATVLFVSHSLNLVERFCSRVVRLERGELVDIGDTARICKEYELEILKEQQEEVQGRILADSNRQVRIGSGEVLTESFCVREVDGSCVTTLRVGREYCFEVEVEVVADEVVFYVNISVSSGNGGTAFSVNSGQYVRPDGTEAQLQYKLKRGRHRVAMAVPNLWLGRGEYFVSISLIPHMKISMSAESYDYVHMGWFFNVERKGLIQWVGYEQPAEFLLPTEVTND